MAAKKKTTRAKPGRPRSSGLRGASRGHKFVAAGFVIIAVAVGALLLGLTQAATPPTARIQGYADYCALESNTTVIYGWAHDADASAGAAPSVQLLVGGQTKTATTSRSYREQQIDSYLASYGVPVSNIYGFRIAYGGLYKGSVVPLGGKIVSTSNGSTPELSINSTHNVDGSALPYFPGNRVPDVCLAVKPTATPRPSVRVTPPPATPPPTPAPVPAPSTPANFIAKTTDGSSVISLSWEASTSSVGVIAYELERSTDGANWQLLDKPNGATYQDRTTTFNIHYFYRVRAVDIKFQVSGFASADATTPAFAQNTSDGNNITSDDGLVMATLPEGAVGRDVACSIVEGSEHSDSIELKKKTAIAKGPYSLVCQDASGTIVSTYNKPIKITLSIDALTAKRYQDFNLIKFATSTENAKWEPITAQYDKAKRSYSFDAEGPVDVVAIGTAKTPFPWGFIVFLVFIVLIAVVMFYFIKLRGQKDTSRQSFKRKYFEY